MTEKQISWYRIPVMWMVVGIPLFSIVFSLSFAWIAVMTFDGVVVDDYYRKGMEINKDLARDRYAIATEMTAEMIVASNQLNVAISSASADRWPDELKFMFIHPTVSNRDVTINLVHRGSGNYSASFEDLRAGKWNVAVGTPSWRLNGSLYHPSSSITTLNPVTSGDVIH